AVKNVSQEIGRRLKKGDTVILRSTVPVGTCRNIVKPILEKESGFKVGNEIHLAFAPERTVEGKAIYELHNLPQIVGGIDKCCTDKAAMLFQEITPTILRTRTVETAEMVKLVNNSFRDLIFGFSNELCMICEDWGIDSVEVIKAANHEYPRDPVPLPSPGVGGVCLNKDAHIFDYIAKQKNKQASISLAARKVNKGFPAYLAKRVDKFIKDKKSGPSKDKIKIFVMGFAFKGEPETSDMRYSTTLDFVSPLLAAGYELHGYDPVVPKDEIEEVGVKFCALEEGFKNADVVAIMNNHRSYKDLDIFNLLNLARKPVLFLDSWHFFEPAEFKRQDGVIYSNLSL
ncbi:MAG: nucleotide sugar dehydrogenase, partial [Candidatus Margulisbacteria bacterium]|nr:nucleotide sugar dehydrogenase [Candidatus Margulisiibacteriota bacterium]